MSFSMHSSRSFSNALLDLILVPTNADIFKFLKFCAILEMFDSIDSILITVS